MKRARAVIDMSLLFGLTLKRSSYTLFVILYNGALLTQNFETVVSVLASIWSKYTKTCMFEKCVAFPERS